MRATAALRPTGVPTAEVVPGAPECQRQLKSPHLW
jgi:hypothetical protein